MENWNIEITDTFGGEANYCWVKRFTVRANTILGAVQKIAREHGTGWRVDYSDGDFARYNLEGSCVCMFVQYTELTYPENAMDIS